MPSLLRYASLLLGFVVGAVSFGCSGNVDPNADSDGSTSGGDSTSSGTGGSGPACGNGVVDPGEACDDGNTFDGDFCSGDCKQVGVCPGDTNPPTGSGSFALAPSENVVALCNGQVLLGDQTNNAVLLFDVAKGAAEKTYSLTAAPRELALDTSRGLLYVAEQASFVAKIDLATSTVTSIPTPAGMMVGVAVGENGTVFASSGDQMTDTYGPTVVLDGVNGTLLKTYDPSIMNPLLAYDRVNHQLLAGSQGFSPSGLTRYAFDAASKSLTEDQQHEGGGNGQDIAVSPDGRHVVYPSGGGEESGYLIDDLSGTDIDVVLGIFDTGAYPSAAAFSLDGKRFATSNTNFLFVFDVATHAIEKKVSVGPTAQCADSRVHRVAFSAGGKVVYALAKCTFPKPAGLLFWMSLD